MFYQIRQYIKFLLKSTNQHGVHSPFVYDLVTTCFYDTSKYKDYHKIEDFKKRLKRTNHKINVTDLGAGSQKIKSRSRKVSDIIKHVCISNKNAKLLYRITNYFKPNSVLELGTSLGFATQSLSLGNPKSEITTIEGCPEISKYTKTNFDLQQLNNIKLITGNFDNEIEKLTSNKYDLIFFDGNHQKEATLNYFETLLQTAHNDSVFIFDDIYWSIGMTEAWNIIKEHPKVTATIDTFYWGIVFFRKEQKKEHFTIRV
ncbi:class I SAM-dependent methyltransferase [Algibacter sp. 2305UL17-15]|uniref:O-methyltransferase n=1 Tax=Algibacter sp. 2305UL17-15 TaxID=3231268 RepID=UPI00345AC5DC